MSLRDVAQLVARLLWEQDVAGSNPVIPTKKVVSFWYDFFYPLRSNGISSPHEVWWISSKRARKSLFFAYHHALVCIKLRNDEILARKRDILVFGRMISSHFVPDDIHFLRKWLNLQAFFAYSRKIQIVHFIPLSFNFWGIVQLLICWRNTLILVRYYAIINSPINKNLRW